MTRPLRGLSAILVRFIPPHLADADFETTQRAYVLVHSSLLGIPALLNVVLDLRRFGSWTHPAVLIGGFLALLPFSIPPLLRWTGSLRFVAVVNPAALYLLFPWVLLDTGGLESPMMAYCLVSALYVTYFVGARWGAVAWMVCAGEATWLWRMHESGRIPPVTVTPKDRLVGVMITGALVLLFAFLYERGNRHAREVQQRKEGALVLAKHEAESAAHLKARFLATMSHEIRTPLNGVLGMTSLLFDTPLSDGQRDLVDTLRASGDSLLGLVNDVLDFSKIEAGQMQLEEQPFDLFACLDSTFDLVAVQAAAKGVELYADVAPDVPRALRGDVTRVRQVLANLVGNAVKFTAHGEVSIRVRRARAPRGERLTLTFEVHDTGPGIAPERLPLLFEPFVQEDASTTRKHGGTGLGLAICRRLVKLMGGHIEASSSPGQGAIFAFDVELAGTEEGARGPTRHTSALAGEPVLLIEDHAPTRTVLARWLAEWGMEVVEVRSVAEARARWESVRGLEVAVLDCTLAGEDPEGLAAELVSAGVQVVMLAPRTSGGAAAGKAVRIFKPVRHAQLGDALVVALGGAVSAARLTVPMFGGALAAGHPLRILVVEDNPVNQKVARLMLAQLGYTADLASDGFEAIDAVKRQPYDLVFMDVQMPGIDGLEVTRRVRRELPAGEQPRIVAMTAYAAQDERRACSSAGMDGFVGKPVVPEELIGALRETRRSPAAAPAQAAATAATTAAAAGAPAPEAPGASGSSPANLVSSPASEPVNAVVLEIETPLDPAQLRSLRQITADTPGLLAELIREHIADVELHLRRLRAALGEGDAETAERVAHTIKGSAGQMAAREVSRMAAMVEAAVRSQRLDEAAKLVAAVEVAFSRARAAFSEEQARAGR